MNIFHHSEWEEDYFKNDLFNPSNYNFPVKFLYLKDFDLPKLKEYENKKNVVVFNRAYQLNALKEFLDILKPFAVFHLSDEFKSDQKYYDLYSNYPIKILFHQYNHQINYHLNHFQIPLGYVKYFLNNVDKKSIGNSWGNKIETKQYDFAFIGSLKNDRELMINKFKSVFTKNYINTGETNWANPKKQAVKPQQMFDFYNKTIFVPIGRGNVSLDCFRLYEVIVAGAIPVIVGEKDEINNTFNFNGNKPQIIIGKNWDKVLKLCRNIHNDKNKLTELINSNKKWWDSINNSIIDKIKEAYNS